MMHQVLFQPLPSILTALTVFLMIVWPGYAVLHVLGHGRHRWPAALFAAPAVTLALWIIALSGAAWASIPLHRVSGPVWIASLLLTALGLALRISVRRPIAAGADDSRKQSLLLWATAVVLPLLTLPATLRYGLGDFVNSTHPDAWSYVMVADYLSAVARGAEGGLSALHQYAAHLIDARNGSSVILAHLAIGLGGVRAAQAMTLFCLLALFANVSALIAFARTVFGRAEPAACLALLAGLGWPANMIFSGNFDQLLLLPLLPLAAALALRAGGGFGLWSGSILIGTLAAAAMFAYIDLAFLGLIIALAFVISPDTDFRLAIGRAVLVCCIATPIALVLTWPGFDAVLQMLTSHYAMAGGTVRPGDGSFPGLGLPLRLPSAAPALGGEFPHMPWSGVPWTIGAFLVAVTLEGAWSERRRWSVMLGFALTAVAFAYFAYRENYSYGAYKIVSVNFWMIGFLTVAGGIRLAQRARRHLSNPVSVAAVIATVLFLVTADRTLVQANLVKFRQNALQQAQYREALTISAIVAGAPTLLAVRDDAANEWAVFYLSDTPLLIAPYRGYMAQAHVIPFMERSRPVDPAGIRYIVTDRGDTIHAALSGARRIWDGQAYSLWSVDDADWAVVADVGNSNDSGPGGMCLGGPKTELLIVTGRSGPAILTEDAQPGLQAAPETSQFHVMVEDAAGCHQMVFQRGQNRLPVDLGPGRGSVTIAVEEPPSGPALANGDVRPMVLRLSDFDIKRADPPRR
jgi:hypothetical protein